MKKLFYLIVFLLPTVCSAQWSTSGSNIYNSNSGNVGIGTSSPAALLHVSNPSSANYWSSHNFGASLIIDGGHHNSIGILDAGSANPFAIANVSGQFVIAKMPPLGNTSTSPAYLMTVGSDGKVGIGTTTPDKVFTVVGDGHFTNSNSSQSADAWFSYLNGTQAHGLFLNTTSSGSSALSYSVVGFATTDTGIAAGIYGLGTATGIGGTAYAGYFNGNVHYTGTLTHSSDIKFKQDISDIESSLSKLNSLKPKSYYFKKVEGFEFPAGKQFGFIAQELKEVFPELVSKNTQLLVDKNDLKNSKTEDFLGVDYISLVPHIIKAIQEQTEMIENYKKSVAVLQDVVLNQHDTISLKLLSIIPYIVKLYPNPTSSLLSITIHNPSTGKAVLIVKDRNGVTRITKPAEVDETSISVSELEDGLYFINLAVDGVSYDIKRFIIAK